MKQSISQFVVLVLALTLNACPQTPAPTPVIVRAETKVLDAATRDSLEAVRDDGTLVFAGATAFKVGDVVVSEPSSAAPEGLLRRVVGMETQNGKTLLRTAQAQIGDALQKGQLHVDQTLTNADLESASTSLEGVRVRTSDGDDLRIGIDVKLGEGFPNPNDPAFTITGEIRFTPVIKVDLDLDCNYLCLYDNDLDFMAQIGIKQSLTLKVVSKAGYDLKKTIPLTTFNFKTKTFYVGPVPVVVKPRIVFELRTDGTIARVISYQVSGNWKAVAGVKYDDGWKNISELNFGFDAGPVDAPYPLAGVADIKVKAALRGELKFYGVIGPTLEIAPYVHIDLAYPRDPFWKLSGGIQANAGIKIDVLGYSKHYQTNLWDDSVEIARSGNNAPQLKFVNPSSSSVPVNQCCTLLVIAADPEDGLSCCAVQFTSSNTADGANGVLGTSSSTGSGTQPELAYTFNTTGNRTITATATDSKGKIGTTTLNLEVVNTPPTMAIHAPFNNQQFFRGVNYTLRGVSYDLNESNFQLPCSGLSWTSSASSDPLPRLGCDVTVSFPSNGARTLTLIGTDSHGGNAKSTVNVDVVDPPANLPPVVNLTKPLGNINIGPDTVIQLAGNATDPEGSAVTLEWDVTTGYNPQTGTGFKTYPVTPAPNGDWKPSDSLTYNGCESEGTGTLRLRLRAKDSQGNEGFDAIVFYVVILC
jgi:hypothetical protein